MYIFVEQWEKYTNVHGEQIDSYISCFDMFKEDFNSESWKCGAISICSLILHENNYILTYTALNCISSAIWLLLHKVNEQYFSFREMANNLPVYTISAWFDI